MTNRVRSNSLPNPHSTQTINWLMVGGSLVTLFLWANLSDPFNAPKSWVLFIFASYLAGWLGFQIKNAMKNKILKVATLLSGSFIFFMFLAFLATGDKYTAFFGEIARRTGFLTYLSLTIFFLSALYLFRRSNISRFDLVTLIVGPIVGFYGFCQHFKIDAIKWNNPYNSVLSTLGNPDFASAVMGIFVVLLFGVVLNASKVIWIRIYAFVSTLLLLVTIIFSQARQGLLAALIGIGCIVVVFLWQKNKEFGYAAAGLGALGLIVGVIGMLGSGPLAKYLYKASVTFRGDYWRAGINMFKHHVLFGVGLDRYGSYFRQYRDATQSLRRGPDTISNAAHNVPIQLAATGGIFVLLSFLALVVFIAWRGIIAIRLATGAQQLVISSYVAAWVTYEAQSFISIDNVGIAIWGWILGGIIIGLSIEESADPVISHPVKVKAKKNRRGDTTKVNESIAQPLVSGIAVTVAIAIAIPLFLADAQVKMAQSYSKPNSSNASTYIAAVKKPLTYGFIDPYSKLIVASLLAQAGDLTSGVTMAKELVASDSRNYDALNLLATIYEQTKKVPSAIPLRRKMIALDPFNQKILLQLGKDLKATGDVTGAQGVIPLIDAFAGSTPEAAQAKSEFGA
ncbi:MAG: O-antigen ligase family protein [Actinomycetes bacterium]